MSTASTARMTVDGRPWEPGDGWPRNHFGQPEGFGLEVVTTNPCPSWCIDEPGHGYDCENESSCPTRWHEAYRGDLRLVDTNQYGRPHELTVTVSQLEAVDLLTRKVVGLDAPILMVSAANDFYLDASEAERWGAMIAEAGRVLRALSAL